jgi:hypothetical protein
MIHLQPSQLSAYFEPGQQLQMQDQIKAYYSTPKKPGFHLICITQQGRNTKYYVAFSTELPDTGQAFIIEVLFEECRLISYKNFLLKANAKTEEPWNNPNRLIALAMHNQQNGIV